MLKHQRWVVHTAWTRENDADDEAVELAIVSALENLGSLSQFDMDLDDEWFEDTSEIGDEE